jgi:5'-nucleotidase (lipoprotein e(P4) family)
MFRIKLVVFMLVVVCSDLVAQTTAPCPSPCPPPPAPLPASAQRSLEIKYVRDSAEYATLARQVYRLAGAAVDTEAARRRIAGLTTAWGVVLDLDETVLDNSVYQLDRASYGLAYESRSWASWIAAATAGSVPGAKTFLDRVRVGGGHVVFITDRDATLMAVDDVQIDGVAATRLNLVREGLWSSDDALCLRNHNTKVERRAAVASGDSRCSWKGGALDVVAFIGDQMSDFPQKSETLFRGAGMDDSFGRIFFLLPNPMYSGAVGWTNSVTRDTRSFERAP